MSLGREVPRRRGRGRCAEYAEDEQNTETDAADALRGGGSTTRGVGTITPWAHEPRQ